MREMNIQVDGEYEVSYSRISKRIRWVSRCLGIFIITLMVCCLASVPVLAEPTIFLNGEELVFEVAPVIKDGRTLVPLRAIFEKIGADVTWDQENLTARAVKGDITVCLTIGSLYPKINGETVKLDVPAQIINGRTMAPLRFVSEAFGGVVSLGGRTSSIFINSNIEPAPRVVWEKVIDPPCGIVVEGIAPSKNGGYFLIGDTNKSGHGEDQSNCLLKTDAEGNIIWSHVNEDGIWIKHLAATSDGGCIACGRTWDSLYDAVVIKFNSQGKEDWRWVIDVSAEDCLEYIYPLDKGGYLAAGYTLFPEGNQNAWFVKMKSDGEPFWDYCILAGGMDKANCAYPTDNGGFVWAGSTTVAETAEATALSGEMSQAGDIQWVQAYPGHRQNYFRDLIRLPEGGYLAVGDSNDYGTYVSSTGDVSLVKTDSEGQVVWEKNYGGDRQEWPDQVFQTPDGGFVSVGWSSSYGNGDTCIHLLKVNPDGQRMWDKTLGVEEGAWWPCACQDDTGLTIAGWYKEGESFKTLMVRLEYQQ